MKGQSINMKTINCFLLVAFWMNSSPVRAQSQNQPKPEQAQPWAPGQEVFPVPNSLEDDPAFKRLSPEAQYWVRTMTNKLHEAIEQRGIEGLDQFKLAVAQGELAGAKFCGKHIFSQWTFVEAVALNESRKEEVFVARWGGVHSAVFTDKRCIASDGDIVDGKLISKILPNSLAVSRQNGLVAYEALFFDHPAEAPGSAQFIQRGVFIENRFLVVLDQGNSVPSRSVRDEDREFWWDDQQERLDMRSGVALDVVTVLVVPMQAKAYLAQQSAPPPTRQPAAPPAPYCAEAPKTKKPRFGLHLRPSAQKTIDRTLPKTADKSGVQVDPKAPGDAIKEEQNAKDQPCPVVPVAPTKQ
jgi:hypothetical protein